MHVPAYPIRTPRLLLRPHISGDLEDLFAIRSRADVTRFLYWEPASREQTVAELDKRVRERTLEHEGDTLHLAMELRDGGRMIGDVGLSWLSERHRQGEIGFVVHPTSTAAGWRAGGGERDAAARLRTLRYRIIGGRRPQQASAT